MKVMKKKKSHIWVPVCGGIIVICVLAVVVLPQNAGDTGDKGDSAVASEERGTFAEEIEQYISPVDYDGDGVDDQTDFLAGVREYIATNPKYKSKYYEGGYPDDGYGVCTDVIAFGLLAAGYDLRELVDADIAAQPEAYAITEADSNIDFRRVVNLKVYFASHAQSLTLDVSDVEEWQGGDIVIFEKHIGVVSDQRNENGVPYIIHHYSQKQTSYEQDILEKRNDIVGHYRIGEHFSLNME